MCHEPEYKPLANQDLSTQASLLYIYILTDLKKMSNQIIYSYIYAYPFLGN